MTRGTTRRGWLLGTAAVAAVGVAGTANAAEQVDAAIADIFGSDEAPTDGRVVVEVPPISENGYSVPVTVRVESPMLREDHVTRIAILSEINPIARIGVFELGPRTGAAELRTRVRLAGSQRLYAVARMNDGSLWRGYGYTIVTLAACVV